MTAMCWNLIKTRLLGPPPATSPDAQSPASAHGRRGDEMGDSVDPLRPAARPDLPLGGD
jgi:hypothetical protein